MSNDLCHVQSNILNVKIVFKNGGRAVIIIRVYLINSIIKKTVPCIQSENYTDLLLPEKLM